MSGSPTGSESPTALLYARIDEATCSQHGFKTDSEREAHVSAIVAYILTLRGKRQ